MNYAPPIRQPLEGERFQVIVIGGGINGVAIARECARAGRRTLLVEQHDFAAGTTSRATRIIHGGLRYLEHAELGLVRESLLERRRLLQERPHLVHPIHFLLALDQNSGRSAFTIRTGLWLYRRLGGGRLQEGSSLQGPEKAGAPARLRPALVGIQLRGCPVRISRAPGGGVAGRGHGGRARWRAITRRYSPWMSAIGAWPACCCEIG